MRASRRGCRFRSHPGRFWRKIPPNQTRQPDQSGEAGMDIEGWLRGLGLEQYAAAFRDNDIDAEVLLDLTADDLIAIGVRSVGHRRKLLAAIAGLRDAPVSAGESPGEGVTAAPQDSSGSFASSAERRQLTVMFCDLV